jgi:hypothetical protein
MSDYEDFCEYDGDYDDDQRLYCAGCGLDWPGCGCPQDMNTNALMRCADCGGEWWRAYHDTSTRCLHPGCEGTNSTVIREPQYAPVEVAP